MLSNHNRKNKVDGVVEIIIQACHTNAIETRNIKRHVNSREILFISIKPDYSK